MAIDPVCGTAGTETITAVAAHMDAAAATT